MDRRTLPDWPAAMREARAASYLDVSLTWFLQHVAPHLRPIRKTRGVVLYPRTQLDGWLDHEAGATPAFPPTRSIIHDHIQATLRGKGRPAKAR